jgi:hypothetical protein
MEKNNVLLFIRAVAFRVRQGSMIEVTTLQSKDPNLNAGPGN